MGILVAAASSTAAPDVVREMLRLLIIQPAGQSAMSFFDSLQIIPGSKAVHVQRLHEQVGTEYSEMIFFDDEARNKNVERELGVFTYLVRDGVTIEVIEEAVKEWRRRRSIDELGRVRSK
jgi:magnesium-dependent phosphatase 1